MKTRNYSERSIAVLTAIYQNQPITAPEVSEIVGGGSAKNAIQNLVCQGMLASDRGQRNKPAIYTVTPDGEWLLKHRAPKVIPPTGHMPTPREAIHGYVPYTPPAWSAPRPGSMKAYELPSLENGVYRPACGPRPIMARSF